MRNLRITLLILAAAIAVTGFSWFGYHFYRKLHRPPESPFNAIPGNTALIIQLNKAGNLLEDLNRTNLLWRALTRFPGIKQVRDELHFVDSASRKNEKVSRAFQQYNILISITLSGRTDFGALYLAQVPGSDPEAGISDFIREISSGKAVLTESPYFTTSLKRVQFKGTRDAFYFSVLKGVFIGSFHADLVKRAIDRLSLNTPLAMSAGFRRVQASAGKKVDANIYINYRFFSLVLSKISRPEKLPDLISLSNFADWSGLDLLIKKDELLFNGITVASDSSQDFLSIFSDQKPQKKEITRIIPGNVRYFLSYGWSDPARFCQRFQNRTPREEEITPEQAAVTKIIDQFQLNIAEYFLPWIGNEGCLFVLENDKTTEEVAYNAFSAPDTSRTLSLLKSLADTLSIRTDSVIFRGRRIYKMDLPAFIPALFGELFGRAQTKCFTLLDGYIIFAGQPRDLEQVINAISENNTLGKDRSYKDFENSLAEKSNVYCYFSTQNAINSLKGMMSQDLSDQLAPVMDSLRKFESVAFQFTSAEGLFYTNVFLRYNPNQGGNGPMEWQARLDTTITGQPTIIAGIDGRDAAVVATDIANNLYMITPGGHIAWKLHIMGNLLGTIHPVRIAGSDSLFLLFNTDTHLYLLHADGRFADKYPMRFPIHATNGITVADWDNNRNYNILVAFQDNRLYNFSLSGTSVPGWKRPGLKEEITAPVTVLRAGGKNYLVIEGHDGLAMVTDCNGVQRITPGSKFLHAPGSPFCINRTGKKGMLLTTDPGGKVVFLQENGKSSEVTLNMFSPYHYFFYEDITGNGQHEFIFIDRDKIFYYNQGFKLIYSYQFRHVINTHPFLLQGTGGKKMVGFVIAETNELFLFDQYGFHELESGIRGNTPFDIGKLEHADTQSLVVGAGNLVKSYRLTKPE